MSLGMEMMLKSLGLDPAEISKTVSAVAETAAAMKQQMDRIESKQKEHDAKLDDLLSRGDGNTLIISSDNPVTETQENSNGQ